MHARKRRRETGTSRHAGLGAALLLLASLLRAHCTPAAAEPDGIAAITLGAAIVSEKCASCHATGPTGTSTHPQAPPFRDIVKRYLPETLAEALGEGIITGHPDMPLFLFEPDEINGIIAYLGTLSTPESRR